MSVSPPTARAKSSVGSKMGGRISPNPKVRKTSWAACSTRVQSAVSGGMRSRVPRIAWNLDLVAIGLQRVLCFAGGKWRVASGEWRAGSKLAADGIEHALDLVDFFQRFVDIGW